MIFVDTSALLAFLDSRDLHHGAAVAAFTDLVAPVTHNYVVVEAEALVRRRLGARTARALLTDVLDDIDVSWIDEALHGRALTAHLASLSRRTSLVDHVSFEFMRGCGIRTAFAFDEHFRDQGFDVVP